MSSVAVPIRLKNDCKKSSGFSSSLSPWNGSTCSAGISSCGDGGSELGSGMVGCLTGETLGVTSKDVEVWVLSMISKLVERPDDGH